MANETRLSEADLTELELDASWVTGLPPRHHHVRALIAEVRALRLSAQDREALEMLRHDIFRCCDYFVEASWYEQARAVLDRLLAAAQEVERG